MRVILLTYGVNTAIKQITRRARPTFDDLPHLMPTISGRSYPSAHASMSFVGVHYPSDVVAGAILGEAMGVLVP